MLDAVVGKALEPFSEGKGVIQKGKRDRQLFACGLERG
jgi:hypothetical protein